MNFDKFLTIVFIFFLLLLTPSLGLCQNARLNNSQDSCYIENVHSEAAINDALITWNIRYDKLPFKGKVIIRFKKYTLNDLKDDANWNYAQPIDGSKTSLQISDLPSAEKIVFSVGAQREGDSMDQIIWSTNQTMITQRGWTFGNGLLMQLLILLGSLGIFIYGMKLMSEGIQKGAGSRLRKILGSMTSNKLKGIFTGFITTSIIQSSSATTVMIVGFVNAGMLSLKESIGVTMGANIGTSITAWLVAFLGFSLSMSDYSLPVFLLAILLIFTNNKQLKSWGEMLAGFALLFIGLEFLKSGVPDIKGSVETLVFLKDMSNNGMMSLLLAILVGTLLTMVIQSSSAAMAVTILLCERGIIPYEMAAGMVLGENIGTTITANIAAIVGNVHAKRSARVHFVFNVIGVFWMIFVFPFFLQMISFIVEKQFNMPNPMEDQSARPIALALFHTLFNVCNVLVLIWFTDYIVRIVVFMVPSKKETDEEFKLEYIAGGVLCTPELSLLEAKKEIVKFASITAKMSSMFIELLYETEKKKKSKILNKIQNYEVLTDRLREEIMVYLSRCSEDELSKESQEKVRIYMAINNDLERIGDIFYQMSMVYLRKEEEKIWFSPTQRQNIQAMLKELDTAFSTMIENIDGPSSKVDLKKAYKNEDSINALRDKLRSENDLCVDTEDFNVKSNMVYTDLIFSCERVGDLIINITIELNNKKYH